MARKSRYEAYTKGLVAKRDKSNAEKICEVQNQESWVEAKEIDSKNENEGGDDDISYYQNNTNVLT